MAREKAPPRVTAAKAAPRKTPSKRKAVATPTSFVDPGKRAALIAEAAYFLAEKRGFAPGNEAQDWLAAEAEVDARLLRSSAATRA